MREVFNPGQTYLLDVSDWRPNLIPEDVYWLSVRGDGRKLGNFSELLLAHRFDLELSENGNTKYDLIQRPRAGGMRVWEVKTATRNGVDFAASSMRGVGRSYDDKAHAERCDNLYGFIVFDIVRAPIIRIRGFKVKELETIGRTKGMTRSLVERYLSIGEA